MGIKVKTLAEYSTVFQRAKRSHHETIGKNRDIKVNLPNFQADISDFCFGFFADGYRIQLCSDQ